MIKCIHFMRTLREIQFNWDNICWWYRATYIFQWCNRQDVKMPFIRRSISSVRYLFRMQMSLYKLFCTVGYIYTISFGREDNSYWSQGQQINLVCSVLARQLPSWISLETVYLGCIRSYYTVNTGSIWQSPSCLLLTYPCGALHSYKIHLLLYKE